MKYRTYTNCGTVGYTSPEVLLNVSQGYSFPSDIWCFGILICELYQGSLPFENKDDPLVIEEQITQCDIKLPREAD